MTAAREPGDPDILEEEPLSVLDASPIEEIADDEQRPAVEFRAVRRARRRRAAQDAARARRRAASRCAANRRQRAQGPTGQSLAASSRSTMPKGARKAKLAGFRRADSRRSPPKPPRRRRSGCMRSNSTAIASRRVSTRPCHPADAPRPRLDGAFSGDSPKPSPRCPSRRAIFDGEIVAEDRRRHHRFRQAAGRC